MPAMASIAAVCPLAAIATPAAIGLSRQPAGVALLTDSELTSTR
jgi:hypothetical protein